MALDPEPDTSQPAPPSEEANLDLLNDLWAVMYGMSGNRWADVN